MLMTKVQLFSLIITAAASINASAQTAYYATPMGLCFAGADEAEADNNATYTISGVRVDDKATMQRGIYVRGGKKFIVK